MTNQVVFLNFIHHRRHNYYFSVKATVAFFIAFCCAILILMVLAATFTQMVHVCHKPNIILIIADDLGWNDIGFHGSNQIPTPNIDALAYHGAVLNRHYTQSVCSPSRAALLTGKYPIRTGMQGGAIEPGKAISVPLNEILLPQYLKKQGYTTGLIGKWHIGYYKNATIPNERGFDSFFGFYSGWVRYNDSVSQTDQGLAYDARRDYERAGDEFAGQYTTDVYTDEAIRVISSHDQSKPLFLEVSHGAVHAILGNGLQVRDYKENEKQFAYIKDPRRRLFAGALSALDESVGRIIQSLDHSGMLGNTIVLFISDNGGATAEQEVDPRFANYGSNWPFRGMKGTLLEGGIRCPAAIWSPSLQQNAVLSNLMHLSDWLPTLNFIAGGDEIGSIDGINQWDYLAGAELEKPRNGLLVNINEETGSAGLIAGDWKLVRLDSTERRDYYSASGRAVRKYDMDAVLSSPTHLSLSKFDQRKLSESDFWRSRNAALIDDQCRARLNFTKENMTNFLPCFNTSCLFNLKEDACEFTDLSEKYPSKVKELLDILRVYAEELVPQQSAEVDPRSDPKYFGGYISPWIY